MSSNVLRLVFNTRERFLSSDLNDAQALQHRALIESIAAAQHGDQQQLGVLRGLTVSIPGGSMLVNVAAGLALRLATPATPYDSALQWIELPASASVDLTSFVDATRPRWVCIEVTGADAAVVQSLRDIFLPANGTFAQATVDKVRGSAPTLHVTAGAPSSTPQFPAGTAGRIPLAYVYIAAGAATLVVTDVVHCRPILRGGHRDAFRGGVRDVKGGGVSVPSAGTTVHLDECTGTFASSHVPFGIAGSVSLAVPTAGWDGTATPLANTPAYFYAVPPPFPAGFDSTLAPREFRPGVSAATRFPSLVPATASGCVVLASTVAPDAASVAGTPVGAGTFSLTAAPWGALAISVPHSQAIYLGAAAWRISSTSFTAQVRGGDWLMLQVPGTQLHDGTVFNFTASDPINIWGDALPLTAREVNCLMTMAPGTATSARIAFDDLGPNVTGTGTLGMGWAGDMPSPITHHFTALPNDDGEITFTAGSVQPTTTDLAGATLYSTGYRDVILERR